MPKWRIFDDDLDDHVKWAESCLAKKIPLEKMDRYALDLKQAKDRIKHLQERVKEAHEWADVYSRYRGDDHDLQSAIETLRHILGHRWPYSHGE